MKTNYFKMIMPIMAILFAIAGSFSSKASENKTDTYVTGYISPQWQQMCSISVGCANSGFQACTATYGGITYQAYGKSSPWDTVCFIFRYQYQ